MAWLREIDRWLIDRVMPHAAIYRQLAAGLVGSSDADDLVHEAYAKLLDYAGWREIESPKAFALQIVRNLALDRLRRSGLVRIEDIARCEQFELADDSPSPHAIAVGRSELTSLFALIETLPPQCQRVLKLRKIDGMAPAAIADLLGISVSTVEKHLAKGLAILTTCWHGGVISKESEPRRPWPLRRNRVR